MYVLEQNHALDRFLATVEKRAYRMAQIATGHDEDALDLVQDAMYTLVQRYATKPEEQWGPLFHRILQNRIRDWYRRTAVRNRLRQWFGGTTGAHEDETNTLENIPADFLPSPDQEVQQRRAVKALDVVLRELPLRQQQVVLLRVWEELDVAETARAMGCSEGSVKTHYFRAIHILRRKLGDHWP